MTHQNNTGNQTADLSAQESDILAKLLKGGLTPKVKSQKIPKRSTPSPVSLSFGQRRLWILDQLVPGTQAGQRKRWILTGGDYEVHLRWQVFEQKGESVVNGLGLDQVIVVQDEDNRSRDGRDVVDKGGKDGFGRRWLRRLKRAQRPFPKVGRSSLDSASIGCPRDRHDKAPQGGDKVSQEADRVVVTFIQ